MSAFVCCAKRARAKLGIGEDHEIPRIVAERVCARIGLVWDSDCTNQFDNTWVDCRPDEAR
jgi:hypothetical protein